jgi:hypothetical protein
VYRILLLGLIATACAVEADDPVDEYPGEEVEEADLTARLPAKVSIKNFGTGLERRRCKQNVAALQGPEVPPGAPVLSLRRFSRETKAARLVLNADTLRTSVVPESAFAATCAEERFANSAYDRSRARSAEGVVKSFADGSPVSPPQVALTVDMCQSSKPWDRELFEWAVAQGEALGRPLPIAIAMTGGWAGKHPVEFRQLQAWGASKKLAIDWVNHSMSHPVNCANGKCTFLTASNVDYKEQVLGLEQVLLEQGETPSAFFRFPGLVHNQARRLAMRELGVVGLDADAWLAKGERIRDGAVILLHGNGNEPAGIRMFMQAMRSGAYAGGEAQGKLKFVSLPVAFAR